MKLCGLPSTSVCLSWRIRTNYSSESGNCVDHNCDVDILVSPTYNLRIDRSFLFLTGTLSLLKAYLLLDTHRMRYPRLSRGVQRWATKRMTEEKCRLSAFRNVHGMDTFPTKSLANRLLNQPSLRRFLHRVHLSFVNSNLGAWYPYSAVRRALNRYFMLENTMSTLAKQYFLPNLIF